MEFEDNVDDDEVENGSADLTEVDDRNSSV